MTDPDRGGGRAPAARVVRPLAGLRYVEVETSRYCNRRCAWCPNGHTHARRVQELMDWGLFETITAELGAAEFAGFFAFHNYNEPLRNPRLSEEITRVRSAVPGAKPAIYTNGDFLTAERLRTLVDQGVAYLRVTRYPHRAEVAPTAPALRRWLATRGLLTEYPWRFQPVRQGVAAVWEDTAVGTRIEVIRPDIRTYNDRGGTATVPTIASTRTAPCQMTSTSASVDYRGNVKMCCNVVTDYFGHNRYVVGNLTEHTLAQLWGGPVMSDWRSRHLVSDWSASPACRTCVQALPETRAELAR